MKDKKYILLQYPLLEMDIDQIRDIVQVVDEITHDMGLKVIAIPESFQWAELSVDELKQVRSILDWVLENKENDTYSKARARIEDSDQTI